jgi:hypothetical protein
MEIERLKKALALIVTDTPIDRARRREIIKMITALRGVSR